MGLLHHPLLDYVFQIVPAVPPGVALIALAMKLVSERQWMKNNHIAYVRRTSLAAQGG